MTLAIQCAVGELGSKPTTELSYSFAGFVTLGDLQFGVNSSGIHLLNSTEQDDSVDYTRSVTLITSDYGIKNPKRLRYVYIGFEGTANFTVSVKVDDQSWRDYTVSPSKAGLQRIRVPIGRDGQGRYWTVKISSTGRFRIDRIDGLFTVRPSGIVGY